MKSGMAIMQPYFFPYLGYYQLVHVADTFVFLDDVNFINKGWINRNQILVQGKSSLFTIPLIGASQNKRINEISVDKGNKLMDKFFRSLETSYSKSPFFDEVFPIVKNVFDKGDTISEIAKTSIMDVFGYLGLEKQFIHSSSVFDNHELKGADRLIDIVRKSGSEIYINPPGGRELYDADYFNKNGIELQFLNPTLSYYPQQGGGEFQKGLSMIDVLFNNSKETIMEFVKSGKLES